jgi:hypothetical protein
LSPWIGYHSEKFGRKPLLLIGFSVEVLADWYSPSIRAIPLWSSVNASAASAPPLSPCSLAAAAVAATVLLWTALTETKPGKYID